jgi:propionyl-CoA carboxylase alpha chain
LPFGSFVFSHEAFLSGHFDTHFVKDHYTPEKIIAQQRDKAELAALVALRHWKEKQQVTVPVEHGSAIWRRRAQ